MYLNLKLIDILYFDPKSKYFQKKKILRVLDIGIFHFELNQSRRIANADLEFTMPEIFSSPLLSGSLQQIYRSLFHTCKWVGTESTPLSIHQIHARFEVL